MKKKVPVIFLILSLAMTIASFIYSNDLEQINSEKVFLTEIGVKNYEKYLEDNNIKEIALAKFNNPSRLSQPEIKAEQLKIKKSCLENDCQFILPYDLPTSSKKLIPLENDKSFATILIDESNGNDIKGMIKDLQNSPFWNIPNNRIQFGGIPYTNMKLDEYSKSIKDKLFPIFFIASFILIYFLFKNILFSLALFIPCLTSSLLSLSLIKYIYKSSNLVLAIIPLMIFILNMSLLFHLFYTAFELKNFREAILKKKQPILLMLISTFIGLISLKTSEIRVIQSFGLTSASLLVITSVYSVAWVYLLDVILTPLSKNFAPRKLSLNFFMNSIGFSKTLVLSIISVFLGFLAFKHIPILTNANDYFPADERVKDDLIDISKNFMGGPILDILINAPEFNDLKQIKQFETNLTKSLNSSQKFLSANKIVSFANKVYSKNDTIPPNLFAYRALLSQAPIGLGSAYSSLKKYRITIFGDQTNVDKYEEFLKSIKKELSKHDLKNYEFNGLTFQLMTAQKEMIFTLFKSFCGTLLVISILTLIIFRNFKIFSIILLVNIVPVFMTFIFYFICGISLNIATVMTFSISLGIIVDSTFHQIHALHGKEKLPKESYLISVVQPIALSALTLSTCFIMFAFNPFLPIRHFGISLCFIIFVGAFFDLKVLPSLLRNKTTI